METVTIACIVEGHGEVRALPELLRRIAVEIDSGTNLSLPRPYRINRSSLLRPGRIEAVVQIQGNRVTGAGGMLVLVDADEDCPAHLGPELLTRAQPEAIQGAKEVAQPQDAWQSLRADLGSGCVRGGIRHEVGEGEGSIVRQALAGS